MAIFLGLAMAYDRVLNELSLITSRKLERLIIIGGGAQHSLLNGLIEKITKLNVELGSFEATALGNI